MDNLTKPLLINGTNLRDDISVVKRADRFFFTEIYELSNGCFLYVFMKLKNRDIKNRTSGYNFFEIASGIDKYLGIIVKENSREEISKIYRVLTTKSGFSGVAGMHELKQELIMNVINPVKNPENFKKYGVPMPNGIILYGPPGTGKTFIVKKLAEELDYKFFDVKHSDLATPFIHGAVGNISKVFEKAEKAAPAVLFFDEISGLVPDRKDMASNSSHKEEEVNEFLMRLQDAGDKRVLVVGATNYINRIDPAVLRPGRFDKKIYVGLPDIVAREELFQLGLSDKPVKDIDYKGLAKSTENFSAADIVEGVIENALRIAANLDLDALTQDIIDKEILKFNIEISKVHSDMENLEKDDKVIGFLGDRD